MMSRSKLTHSIVHRSIGNGPAMVLIHGMGSASSAWKTLIPHLRDEFQLIVVDLPGHGGNPLAVDQAMSPDVMAEEITYVLNDYGIHQAHIVGNSWGGWIALELGALFEERIASITAIAPAGLWLTPYTGRYPAGIFVKQMATVTKSMAGTMLHFEWARKLGFSSVSPQWRNYDYQLCLDAAIAMGTAEGYLPAWEGLLHKRFDKSIQPRIPLTVLFGDSDNTLPVTTCQERSLVPTHAKWIVMPEAGHAPMWDYPADVASIIKETANKRRE